MSRTGTFRLGLLLAVLLAPLSVAEAAGSGRSFRHAPGVLKPAGVGLHERFGHTAAIRHDRFTERGGRHWRRGRGPLAAVGYPGPWSMTDGQGSVHARSVDRDDAIRPVDRRSFEHMPVQVGIVRPPTPEPTLYRLEGRRDRPATRVIRINDPEPRDARRSRFAHAETGALLLTVPRR
ncbi:hypothetical protein IP69_05940 [Bosea sp. AAP35]|uniref:hypothetical protein n=1 Tax=Bosea sp. AAP35 TaxID=1523417 RepID=UPI0006B88C6E|nr:hypothetical protein [Bosea sp. AAP35]KPF71690.1 hypothetical protein IP69_05940 [Bosea sp. AAP35]